MRGHVTIDREMRVQTPFHQAAAGLGLQPGSLHDSRQGRNQGAVNERHGVGNVLQSGVSCQRLQIRAEFRDDLLEQLGIEHVGRFR